jgi:hypothetical protein
VHLGDVNEVTIFRPFKVMPPACVSSTPPARRAFGACLEAIAGLNGGKA